MLTAPGKCRSNGELRTDHAKVPGDCVTDEIMLVTRYLDIPAKAFPLP